MQEILDNLKLMHEAAREEYEESKKRPLGLNEHKALQASWKLLDEMFAGAEEAVEKQIPKKPISTSIDHELADLYVGLCPICRWGMNSAKSFCDNCGQAIGWGE